LGLIENDKVSALNLLDGNCWDKNPPLPCCPSALYKLRFGNVDFHKAVEILAQIVNGETRQKLRLCCAVNLADKIYNLTLAHFNASEYQSVTNQKKYRILGLFFFNSV